MLFSDGYRYRSRPRNHSSCRLTDVQELRDEEADALCFRATQGRGPRRLHDTAVVAKKQMVQEKAAQGNERAAALLAASAWAPRARAGHLIGIGEPFEEMIMPMKVCLKHVAAEMLAAFGRLEQLQVPVQAAPLLQMHQTQASDLIQVSSQRSQSTDQKGQRADLYPGEHAVRPGRILGSEEVLRALSTETLHHTSLKAICSNTSPAFSHGLSLRLTLQPKHILSSYL